GVRRARLELRVGLLGRDAEGVLGFMTRDARFGRLEERARRGAHERVRGIAERAEHEAEVVTAPVERARGAAEAEVAVRAARERGRGAGDVDLVTGVAVHAVEVGPRRKGERGVGVVEPRRSDREAGSVTAGARIDARLGEALLEVVRVRVEDARV